MWVRMLVCHFNVCEVIGRRHPRRPRPAIIFHLYLSLQNDCSNSLIHHWASIGLWLHAKLANPIEIKWPFSQLHRPWFSQARFQPRTAAIVTNSVSFDQLLSAAYSISVYRKKHKKMKKLSFWSFFSSSSFSFSISFLFFLYRAFVRWKKILDNVFRRRQGMVKVLDRCLKEIKQFEP